MSKVVSIRSVRQQKNVWEYKLSSPVYDVMVTLKDRGRVNRKAFLITNEDVGKITISLGKILKHDVGRYYIVDEDRYDYIVDELPETRHVK